MKKVKFKKLDPAAIIPSYKSKGAAGFDIHVTKDITIDGGRTAIVPTGLAVAVPEGYEMQIRPRSGISAKTSIRLANSPGTIDSDYRGEVGVIVSNMGRAPVEIVSGMRLCQGLIKRAEQFELIEVDELDETDRGEGGFGSTGVQ